MKLFGGHVVGDGPHQRRARHRADRIIILQRVEAGRMLLVQRLVDAERVLRHQHGVAVGRRARDLLPGDVAAGAALVLDHDRLAERGAKLVR